MRAKLILLSAFIAGTFGGALASGCQTYDFEPVAPLALAQTTVGDVIKAQSLKPNMMVLLDTSGSMTLPVDASDPDCQAPGAPPERPLCGDTGNPPCNVNLCPTRWSELRSAMAAFLSTSGAIARMGLTTYPGTTNQCASSSSVRIAIPDVEDTNTAALQSTADQISDVILSIPLDGAGGPIGGTPTSFSLRFVGEQPALHAENREDFVLLLTDGLPNCNGENPNGGDAEKCRCTQSQCPATLPPLLCLDKDESVSAVNQLRNERDVRTIVIGFGADFSEDPDEDPDDPAVQLRRAGRETLNAMAEAGGFARSCANDPNACGAGDTCDPSTNLCARRFYLAANQQELAQALQDIINRVGSRDICLLALEPNQLPRDKDGNLDPKLIVVYVDDVPTPSEGTWDLTDQGVRFKGATCDRIKASTEANPIKLEARAVRIP